MPIARFQTEDGRVARFEVPEGTTPEQAQTIFNQWSAEQGKGQPPAQQPAQPSMSASDAIVEGMRSAQRGMTFGASKYIRNAEDAIARLYAGMRGLPEPSPSDKSEQFKKEYPGTALATELAGGMLAPLPMGKAVSLPGRIAEGAGIGAGAGAISGAIASDTSLGDMAAGAGAGAGIGGGIGAALPMAGKAIGAVAAPFISRATAPETVAAARLGKELTEGGITPEMASRGMKSLGRDAMLLDVGGDAVTGLAESVAQQPGQGRAIIKQALDARQASAPDRAWEVVNKGLKPDDFGTATEGAISRLKANADQLYGEVRKKVPFVWSQDLDALLSDRPSIREAFGTAMKRAADMGERFGIGRKDGRFLTLEQFEKGDRVEALTFDAAQRIKTVLDGMIDDARNPLTGGMTDKGRSILKAKNDFMEAAERSDPTGLWRNAREQYAGDAAVITALRDGRKVLREEPWELATAIKDMSFAEKDAYLTGAAETIRQKIMSAGDNANAVRSIVGNKLMRERLRPLFDKERDYLNFIGGLHGIGQMKETSNRILSGAQTAYRNAMRQDDTGVAGNLAEQAGAATRGFLPWLSAASRQAWDAARAPREDVRTELAKMLTQRDPDAGRMAIDAWKQGSQQAQQRQNQMDFFRNRGAASLTNALAERLLSKEQR